MTLSARLPGVRPVLAMDNLRTLAEMAGSKPEYFGLGFIQLKVSRDERIHFYTKDIDPILDDEEIHNHRYNFTSTVLKGQLTNVVYYWKEVEDSDWELAEVSCTPNDSREPRILLPNVEKVELATFHTPAGSSYSVTDSMFHQVRWNGDLVTRLHRGPLLEEFAKVIRNKKEPYVCPFSTPMGEAKAWEWIEKITTSGTTRLPEIVY